MLKMTRHPIAYSLVFGFVLLATLSLSAILHSLFMTSVLSGDAGAINIAGSLRMQSYRIAYELKRSANPTSIAALIVEFDQKLDTLITITSKHVKQNQQLIEELEGIQLSFENMKQLAYSNPETYHRNVDGFVSQVDAFVESYEHWAEAKVSALHRQQIGASVFTLFIALIFTALIYCRLVVPLQKLTNTVIKLGKGDTSARVPPAYKDELGQLATTLNRMAEEISQYQTQLENKIIAQTKELSRNNQILEFLFNLSKRLSAFSPDITGIKQHTTDALSEICHEKTLYWQTNEPKPRSATFYWVHIASDHSYLVCDSAVVIEPWKKQIFETIGDLFENAYRRSETLGNEKRIALHEERNAIARELHDSLAQNLSYLKIQVVRFAKQKEMGADSDTLNATLQELREGLNSSYRKLRELLVTFRTQHEELSFEQGLQNILDDFNRQSGNLSISLHMDECWPGDLDAHEEVHCLHIIREALTNVFKHASATRIQVRLKCNAEQLKILICDNGIGFMPEPNKPEHYGLTIMAERAQRIGGSMTYGKCEELGGACVKLEFNKKKSTGATHG
ncbi:type IV pili methyl-accepting chemotaxis transducer N-terminal domain-containing protein [Reinekea marinisedimentorum]|uniref:Sensor protein n=1 Tax=Reinekea marinisedimentorum TaxID=230495 RepID=A0A4R3I7M4_9GAMM|nr:histidine kinase [Reinekea marinisedimentorum]TCS40131.1 two-component system nitrate/nitrite sensor histidine kinase NarX/two-component system nitrate/nitrite sensor histidine kinase NarQ [Reinekea marinisedimentorum]